MSSAAAGRLGGIQQTGPDKPPPVRPSTGSPNGPSMPPGMPNPPSSHGGLLPKGEPSNEARLDPKLVLQANQKDLHRDVDQLLQLAQELKKEVDKTDGTAVLSLSMLKKADEIQKLAHQIASLAKS